MTENQPPAEPVAAPPSSGPVFAPPVAPLVAPLVARPVARPDSGAAVSARPAVASAGPTPFGAPASTPGWSPPPKPGLIPLRPLSLGVILGGSFSVLRKSPQATLLPALIASLVAALAGGLLSWVAT